MDDFSPADSSELLAFSQAPFEVPEEISAPVLKKRDASGFWGEPPSELPSINCPEGVKVCWNDLGVTLAYAVSENIIGYYSKDVTYRKFRSVVFDNTTGQPVALAHMTFVQNLGIPYGNQGYYNILDDHSQQASNLGHLLATSCDSLADVFEQGRTIAKFEWLEILPGCRLQGKGVEIGERLMRVVASRYQCTAFIYEPFPLQYSVEETRMSPEEAQASWATFLAIKDKLSGLYQRAWGAVPLPIHGHLVSSPDFAVRLTPKDKWHLRRKSSKAASSSRDSCRQRKTRGS